MGELQEFLAKVRLTISMNGFDQVDSRFNRTTRAMVGYRIQIIDNPLAYIKNEMPLDKYREDWFRMKPSFDEAIREVNRNPDSRRLVVLNTEKYQEVQPCFLSMQFLKDETRNYKVVVFQRSQDLEKMKDDLVFFGMMARKFEIETSLTVDGLSVVYANIHYTKE